MELEEARDILANCIDDYVIAEYCSSCDDKESCKNDDCIFSKSIEVVLNHLTKQEKMIELMVNALYDEKYEELICMEVDCDHITIQQEGKCIGKDCIKEYFEKKAVGDESNVKD